MSCLAVAILSATLAAGNAEFDDSARNGAAKIAVARLSAGIGSDGPGNGAMEEAMLAGVEAHSSCADSKLICREVYVKSVERRFESGVAAIRAELKLGDGFAPTLPEQAMKAAMDRFDGAFELERKSACARQAASIAGGIRPSESEVESMSEERLREELVARIASHHQGGVFEENRKYISIKLAGPIIDSAKREMKRQREYLMRAKCDSFSPSAASSTMSAGLRKNVESRRSKEGDPAMAWGVFPLTLEKTLPLAVERRMVEHVVRKVDGVVVVVDEAAVREVISANPPAHRTLAGSEALFRKEYRRQIVEGAVASAEREAPESCGREFSEYIGRHLENDALDGAVKTRMDRELMPAWKNARALLAERDFSHVWPALADRTWYPGGELADRIAASSDYEKRVVAWRNLPEMRNLAARGEEMGALEESDALADECVRRAFDLARNAINAQMSIVDAARPSVRAEAMDRKRSFWRITPGRKGIAAMLAKAVECRWGADRMAILWGKGSRPANASEQHAELFPSVRKYIELVAGEICEQVEAPEDKGYSIVISRCGDRVDVSLRQGGKTVVQREAKAEMSDYREAVRSVSDHLATEVLGIGSR